MPVSPVLKRIAVRCVARADGLGYRGKKRDDFVLDYFVGAMAGIEATQGNTEDLHLLERVSALILSIRGFAEVKRIAEDTAT
jgi:hypothetical protein